MWIHGPFPAGHYSDIKIFRRALKYVLESTGERAEADDGYKGEPFSIDLPSEGCCGDRIQKKIKAKVRSRHESVNRLFKNFGCLKQRFRHNLNKHKLCFDAVATIVQIGIRTKNIEVFEVKEYRTKTLNMLNEQNRII